LALIVSRNVTTRDNLDHQQPRNLRVVGGAAQTIQSSGKIYDVAHLQIFQGDLIRGYSGSSSTQGRRVIAQPMHDGLEENPENSQGPDGSFKIGYDGSMAALVPARRALTRQLTDQAGEGVVRERLWLTFQPGEIRVCTSCHGINSHDQAGQTAPTNSPQSLLDLLEFWNKTPHDGARFSFKGHLSTKSDRKIKLKVIGQNQQAIEKSLSLSLSIKHYSCGTIKEFSTNSDGMYKLSKRLPISALGTKLKFILRYLGSTIGTRKINARRSAKKSKKSPKKICRQIKRSFQD